MSMGSVNSRSILSRRFWSSIASFLCAFAQMDGLGLGGGLLYLISSTHILLQRQGFGFFVHSAGNAISIKRSRIAACKAGELAESFLK